MDRSVAAGQIASFINRLRVWTFLDPLKRSAMICPHRVADAGTNDFCVGAGTVAWCARKVIGIVDSE